MIFLSLYFFFFCFISVSSEFACYCYYCLICHYSRLKMVTSQIWVIFGDIKYTHSLIWHAENRNNKSNVNVSYKFIIFFFVRLVGVICHAITIFISVFVSCCCCYEKYGFLSLLSYRTLEQNKSQIERTKKQKKWRRRRKESHISH